ncbi:hypothetical protein Bca101_033619 [Brassica carinata]
MSKPSPCYSPRHVSPPYLAALDFSLDLSETMASMVSPEFRRGEIWVRSEARELPVSCDALSLLLALGSPQRTSVLSSRFSCQGVKLCSQLMLLVVEESFVSLLLRSHVPSSASGKSFVFPLDVSTTSSSFGSVCSASSSSGVPGPLPGASVDAVIRKQFVRDQFCCLLF